MTPCREENNYPQNAPINADSGRIYFSTFAETRREGDEYSLENIIVAVIMNVIVIYIVLKTSAKIERVIGQNGISIIRKVFGVILLAIAVKLFAHNIKELFIQ